ncbi:nucleolar protein dao-5-like [Cyprinodon tularosa]|uniref:nucleolar protein dao-5-like n=1 Tax=Cyprinodon tularosa TaxID=77115 RepID=UPI0018E201B8|nr:nucleolar protein dao-5-like [Cyprinodon tularosa]
MLETEKVEELKAASVKKAAKKKNKVADSVKDAKKEKTKPSAEAKKEKIAKVKSKLQADAKRDKPVKGRSKPSPDAKKESPAKEKTKSAPLSRKEPAAVQQKRKSVSKRTASAVKSKVKASINKKDSEPKPQPLRLRTRPEADMRTNVTSQAEQKKPIRISFKPGKTTKAEKKPVKEDPALDKEKQSPKTKNPGTEDSVTDGTEKKKPSQKYFQCIYFPGKQANYPLRPFTPAVSPAMLSPAVRSMLEQRAARAAGQ